MSWPGQVFEQRLAVLQQQVASAGRVCLLPLQSGEGRGFERFALHTQKHEPISSGSAAMQRRASCATLYA